MSSKRSRTDETPDEVNLPSVESLLREQHQQLLNALTRLEAHNRQVVAESEKEINDLKRQNQELRTEVESLRTAISSPPAVVSQLSDRMADKLNQITKVTSKLGLKFRNPKNRKIDAFSFVLTDEWRLSNLELFLRRGPRTHSLAGLPYCIDRIKMGAESTAVFGRYGTSCNEHKEKRDVCVWIIERENGWVVGSGPAS